MVDFKCMLPQLNTHTVRTSPWGLCTSVCWLSKGPVEMHPSPPSSCISPTESTSRKFCLLNSLSNKMTSKKPISSKHRTGLFCLCFLFWFVFFNEKWWNYTTKSYREYRKADYFFPLEFFKTGYSFFNFILKLDFFSWTYTISFIQMQKFLQICNHLLPPDRQVPVLPIFILAVHWVGHPSCRRATANHEELLKKDGSFAYKETM
jgi:hypothetical protein